MLIALIILIGLVSFIVKMCLRKDDDSEDITAVSTLKKHSKKKTPEFIKPVKSELDLNNL